MKKFVKQYKTNAKKISEKLILRAQISLSVGIKRVKDLDELIAEVNPNKFITNFNRICACKIKESLSSFREKNGMLWRISI